MTLIFSHPNYLIIVLCINYVYVNFFLSTPAGLSAQYLLYNQVLRIIKIAVKSDVKSLR